jgi:hypothetical protein
MVASKIIIRFLLFAIIVLLFPYCSGKKESKSLSPSGVATDGGGIPQQSASPGGQPVSIGSGKASVLIVPSIPSRLDPPRAVVTSPPGSTRNISWRINGKDGPDDERLDPGQFEKGDRIQAVVKWVEGNTAKIITSREVTVGNSPPTLGEVRLDRMNPVTGGTVHAIVASNDMDGDKLSLVYQWYVDDKEVPGGGDLLSLNGVRKGSWIHFRVEARDEDRPSPWKFSPKYKVVNSLPVVRSALPPTIPSDRKFVYRIVAEDPDGDALTYRLAKSPPGVVLNGSSLEWQIPQEYIGKNVEIVVNISDGDGGTTQLNINMTVREK